MCGEATSSTWREPERVAEREGREEEGGEEGGGARKLAARASRAARAGGQVEMRANCTHCDCSLLEGGELAFCAGQAAVSRGGRVRVEPLRAPPAPPTATKTPKKALLSKSTPESSGRDKRTEATGRGGSAVLKP